MGKLRIKKSSRVHLKAAHFKHNEPISPNSDLPITNNKNYVLKPASFDPYNTVNEKNDSKDEDWTVVKTSRLKSIKSPKDQPKNLNSKSFSTQKLSVRIDL